MSAERTNSTAEAATDPSEPDWASSLPASRSVKRDRLLQDPITRPRDLQNNRSADFVGHGETFINPESRQMSPAGDNDFESLSSHILSNSHDNSSSVPSNRKPLIHSVYSEFRRVNDEVRVDQRHISLDQRLQTLSTREFDVLILMIQGKTCKEVAARLEIGLATAAKHRASIFKKLQTRNCTELIHLLSTVFIRQNSATEYSDEK